MAQIQAEPAAVQPHPLAANNTGPSGPAGTMPQASPVRVGPLDAGSARANLPDVRRTPRLEIRRLEETDRDAYINAITPSRAHVAPWLPLYAEAANAGEIFDRELAAAREGDRRGTAWRRVAFVRDASGLESVAGGVNLSPITRGLAWEADATWWIAAQWLGRGLAREAIASALSHAFEPLPWGLGLSAVHAGIEPENHRSVRTARACGFRHVPGRRSHLKVGDRWAVHEFYIAEPG